MFIELLESFVKVLEGSVACIRMLTYLFDESTPVLREKPKVIHASLSELGFHCGFERALQVRNLEIVRFNAPVVDYQCSFLRSAPSVKNQVDS